MEVPATQDHLKTEIDDLKLVVIPENAHLLLVLFLLTVRVLTLLDKEFTTIPAWWALDSHRCTAAYSRLKNHEPASSFLSLGESSPNS